MINEKKRVRKIYRESWEPWVTSSRCHCPPFANRSLLKILLRIMFNSFLLIRQGLSNWVMIVRPMNSFSKYLETLQLGNSFNRWWKHRNVLYGKGVRRSNNYPPLDKYIRKTNTCSEGSDSSSESHNLKFRESGDTPTSISSDSENCLNTHSVPHLDIASRISSPLSEPASSHTPASPGPLEMSTAFLSLGLSPITYRIFSMN